MNRILIVDDDEDILETISLILELCGYDVRSLLTAQNIESEIDDFKPHLIVLDIVIGNLDGRNICKTLKQNPRHQKLPILMMSAMYQKKDIMGKEACPDEFLVKPFDINEFVETISMLIGKKKKMDYNIN